MTSGNGNGARNGNIIKTTVVTIGETLKGSPLTFGLVVINGAFILLVVFMLWHVSNGIERRDKMISDCIERKT